MTETSTVSLNLRLPRDLHARLTELAAADRRSLNSMIVVLLERAAEVSQK
jgi:predicted HicB family RNase H-like nuclease